MSIKQHTMQIQEYIDSKALIQINDKLTYGSD